MINVIHIFGAPGSGVTTIGRAIADAYGVAFLDLDLSEYTDETRAERVPDGDRLLDLANALDASNGQAVIAGDLTGWGDELRGLIGAAVFVTAPEELRLARLLVREKAAFGDRVRPDGDLHETYTRVLREARLYASPDAEGRSISRDEAWRSSLECPVLAADGAKPVAETVSKILTSLVENDFPDGVESDPTHMEDAGV